MSSRTFELHGVMWREGPGWHVVREWLDAGTGLLAAVSKHDQLALLKAELCFPFEQGFEQAPETPRWEACTEALFGPEDLEAAAHYLESEIRNRPPRQYGNRVYPPA